ncbi:SRR1-like protein [Acropora cervicornis]|uniref:SRR1-like protein n=1 Tax=Acropora cervicornis TaxID=6130 RepID=A0AAD9R6V0_ACRCE|nr:SRR1-like protein [Acropora cervicornis]
MADAEGFEVVKKRRGHKNRKSDENYRLVKFNSNRSSSFETTQFDLNQVKMNIDKYRHEKNSILSHSKIPVCLLAVIERDPADRFITDTIFQIAGQCFIYEPLFSQDEIETVKELGCSLIQSNEEGKRKVGQVTLFFMLHCGKPLYNSVLWANWGLGLSNVIILGNRFSSYKERIPSRQLMHEACYIYNILPYTAETPIHNSFCHSDIFNDSSIHWFPRKVLLTAPLSVWENCKEPSYDSNDPEIITKSSSS